MSSIKETAARFFESCETGKGWGVCSQFCHPNATFSVQAAALAGIDTLEGYTEWVKGLAGPMPDNTYDMTKIWNDGYALRQLGWG